MSLYVLVKTKSMIYLSSYISLNNSKQELILGLTIDNKLLFDGRIKNICGKASLETSALSRISGYLDLTQKEILFKAMIRSQNTRVCILLSGCSPQEYLIRYMKGL